MGIQINGTTDTISAVDGSLDINQNATFGNNVTIGGTLTYSDVTNIDSVGLVTAKNGLRIHAGGIDLTSGISTFSDNIQIADKIIHKDDTNTAIRFPDADTFAVETAGTERLRIASNGRVGINTITPGTNLTVWANDSVTDTDVFQVRSKTGAFNIQVSDSDASNPEWAIRTYSSEPIVFKQATTERMRIKSDGNVGIGTDNPQVKLTVSSTSPAVCDIHHIDGGTNDEARIILGALALNPPSNRGAGIAAVNNGAGHDLIIKCSASHAAGPTEKLRIKSDGKMGLGTNSPTALLHVTSGSSPTILNKPSDATPAIFTGDSNRTSNGQHLVEFRGNWNGTLVSRMVFSAGDDTTNKDNGNIDFYTAAAGTTALALRIKPDGNITTDYNIKSNNLSGRNVVINGDMRVAQRATSASMSNAGNDIPVCDRWNYNRNGVTATVAQVEEAPAGRGFKYSLKWTSTSAVGSIAAGNNLKFAYKIERQDIQRLGYGSSNAKKATLSFWAKGSIAGKIGVSCTRNSRITSHNVDMTANTWEYHEIVIPTDTSTALSGTDTDSGFDFGFCWGAGSNSTSGATNGWIGFHNAYTAGFTAGQQGAYLTTSGSTFQITGVQLEVGSVSTPFEHKSYAEELRLCQRYYNEVANTRNQGGNDCTLGMFCQVYDGTGAHIIHRLDPPMRVVPDLATTESSGSYVLIVGNSSDTFDSIIENSKTRWTNQNVELWCTGSLSGLTAGHAAFVRLRSAVATTVVAFDAEL